MNKSINTPSTTTVQSGTVISRAEAFGSVEVVDEVSCA